MTEFLRTPPKQSWTFSNDANAEIRRAAATGIYDIRGGGSKRKLPHFDDLLFLGASISRYPLEGYREKCSTIVCAREATAASSGRVDIPSQARISTVPHLGAGRMSQRTSLASAITPVRTMSSR